MIEFLDFSDVVMCAMGGRETVIARHYFEKGVNLGIFKTIQIDSSIDSILHKCSNIAWDLAHVRHHLERSVTIKPEFGARYFVPFFLTFDRGLGDVIDMYPLKCIAYPSNGGNYIAFYKGDYLDVISTENFGRDKILERYYSSASRSRRKSERPFVQKNINSILNELKNELIECLR